MSDYPYESKGDAVEAISESNVVIDIGDMNADISEASAPTD